MLAWKDAVNQYIDILWSINRFSGNFVEKFIVDQISTTLTAPVKQKASTIALQIIQSQRKKHTKIKPVFSGSTMELDQRFFELQQGKNSFDLWVKLTGFGNRIKVFLPTHKHKHFNQYTSTGWILKKSATLRWQTNSLMLDVYLEKENPALKEEGAILGLDCGYKKLAVLSNQQAIGTELPTKIAKINRKRQGSKAFKRALSERNDYINGEIKKLPWDSVKAFVVEALKNVKRGTKGLRSKQFNNKIQRWVYAYFLRRLEERCEVGGVHYHTVNPAYTSQECSVCGDTRRENRKGEIFLCQTCGHEGDADFNASKNILNRFLRGTTEPREYENFSQPSGVA